MEWHYVADGEHRGPVPEEALVALLRTGQLQPFDLVWTERLPAWTPVHESGLAAMSYASFGSRLGAALIDSVVLILVQAVTGGFVGLFVVALGGDLDTLALDDASAPLGAFVGWLYYSMCESSSAMATLGKRAVGIVVVSETGHRLKFGQAAGRWFGRLLSAIPIGIGFLAMLWSPRRQCWHDRLARTIVLRRARA